jgi:hypothetical protein
MMMSEKEWLTCADPLPMLQFAGHRISDRQFRLFVCACCRRIWHLLAPIRSRRAVEVAELYADGIARAEELWWAGQGAWEKVNRATFREGRIAASVRFSQEQALSAAAYTTEQDRESLRHALISVGCVDRDGETRAALLRDIVGNPFRPVTAESASLARRNLVAVQLAQTIYEQRTFADVPILADALEEAGCTSADLLSHCRGPGPHVRGCFALDLILGKS